MKILYTGSAGFIGQYGVEELVNAGHEVIGLDNFSKYGKTPVAQNYRQVEGDAKDASLLLRLLDDCDHFIAGAAMVGGIGYFHRLPYDLLAENDRLTAAAFDAAIQSFKKGRLQKITVLSSSMVYENATLFPTPEGHEKEVPPPQSSYGFQKLACEYYARAGYEQHGLPYTIVRPFNCVGIGEYRPKSLSQETDVIGHAVPDLILKILKEPAPVKILGDGSQIRHFTYGKDLAKGIRLSLEKKEALLEDFNLSTEESTTVLSLARLIWEKIHPDKPFTAEFTKPMPHDVPKRVPDVSKAKEKLGFYAETPLTQILGEVIPWVKKQMEEGRL